MLESPVNNQLIQVKPLKLRISLTIILLFVAIMVSVLGIYSQHLSDPYIQEVLSLQGNPVKGHAIYKINCAGCHGLDASGIVGPSLHGLTKHKSKVGIIRQVTSGKTPPMPKFQPNSQEMADLLIYLQQL